MFQCTSIPLALTNAPTCFQRTLDLILTNYKGKTCLVYLEDVIIFSRNMYNHIKHDKEILKTLSDSGVMLKTNKCDYFQLKVEY